MKVFARIVIYFSLALMFGFMGYLTSLDVDLYNTKITPETIQLFNPSSGKYLFFKTWKLIQSTYYDPSLNKQDWKYWQTRYLDNIKTTDDAFVAINSMLASLDDPYSIFMNKEDFQEQLNQIDSKINGIGVHITYESGKVTVFSVVAKSPAEKAGLESGDIIIKIDDTDTQGLGLQATANLIRGKKGTAVNVTVIRKDKKITKRIIRDEIKIENVSHKMIDGYAYIKLDSFIAETMPEEINEAIKASEEQKAKGYIVDLRGNTGGLLSNAIFLSNIFLEKGDIVLIVNRNGVQRSIKAKYNKNAIKKPLVILINPLSASASEIFSGAMKDNNRAVLVGDTTFGKGLVQKVHLMPGDTGLNLTISRYLTPNGTDIHKIGIKPDYEVKMYSLTHKNDIQLKKALEVIKNIK